MAIIRRERLRAVPKCFFRIVERKEYMNKVNISGVNTNKLPKFSDAQKTELLIKIKNGDTEARDEFIKGNLRLVLSVVKKFTNRNESVDDLFQIGCVGLIKAIDNFSLEHNVKFSTYAVPMNVIKGNLISPYFFLDIA